jgi:serine/threonine-protein kinase
MSRVWLARHRELLVPAILKTMREVGSHGDAFARLLNEARLMARIPSPRVVRAVDVGVYEDCAYLAEEYVDGLDLAELDGRRRRALRRGLPLWFVCRVMHEVADALHSAHQTGVLHRDVKPSNLFGSPQTGIRLGDFGIAMHSSRKDKSTGGTLRFIAPETLRGEAPSRRSDTYSLGATAFDLYYGRPPFNEVKDIVGDAPLCFPPARSPEEASFQHVVTWLLARDPALRPGSMASVRRMFGGIAESLHPTLSVIALGPGSYQVGSTRVTCTLGDIAVMDVDAIVNSANDEMRMRTGVGEALRMRGGQLIEDEAMSGGRRALGVCVATKAGALGCKHVIHAVSAWNEASCIARTSQRVFLMAEEIGARTLAIPALGTGLARVTPETSAYATASALYEHLLLGGSRLREVKFVLYDADTMNVYMQELADILHTELEPIGHQMILNDADVSYDETLLVGPEQSLTQVPPRPREG